jgi:protein-tyrosine phosphatase
VIEASACAVVSDARPVSRTIGMMAAISRAIPTQTVRRHSAPPRLLDRAVKRAVGPLSLASCCEARQGLGLSDGLRSCDHPSVSTDGRAPHWIALDGAVNARVVVPGVLLRSDNLQSLSTRDVRRLVEQEALEVVIDLRTDIEVALEGPGPMTVAAGVLIEHRSLYPESGANTDLDADTVKPWGPADENESPDELPVVRAYMSYLRRRPDSIVGAVRAIARADGAVLVHCAAGKDRTGVVIALALDAVGVDREAIVSDYLATRERIDAIIGRLVSSSTYRDELDGHDPQRHAPVPGTIERVLELVDERFGGSAAWLSGHALSDPDLGRLGRRLAPARRVSGLRRGSRSD